MDLIKPVSAIFLCVLLAGCSQDEYSIEREYYRVQRQAGEILGNPEATPPRELAAVVDALNGFLARYPKSNVAVESQFTIARIYIATGEYAQAHEQLKKIMRLPGGSGIIQAEAMFMRGEAYEAQNEWGLALEQYQSLIREHPVTPRGLEVPVYIALHYKRKLQPEKMIEAFREAIGHYTALAEKYPATPLALQCRTTTVRCFLELNESEKAIAVLESSIKEFNGKIPVDELMLTIANIYYTRLKNVPEATAMLDRVIREFPGAASIPQARLLLDKINAGKDPR